MAQITTQHHLSADPNGNHDSGYAPSNVTDIDNVLVMSQHQHSPPRSPKPNATIIVNRNATNNKRNGSPKKEPLR
jgi:dopamine receptor D2